MSNSACFSDLEMSVNPVCTLKIDGKHDLLTVLSSRGQKQNATKLSRRAREVADDVSKPTLLTSLKSDDVTNL